MPPNTQQKSQTKSVGAPVGGLNAVNSIADMPPTDAVIMDNMFPSPTSVDSRNGYTNWLTGVTGWVETLAAYNQQSGVNKLLLLLITQYTTPQTRGLLVRL